MVDYNNMESMELIIIILQKYKERKTRYNRYNNLKIVIEGLHNVLQLHMLK